ncbi:hypothetical protein [Streptomyces sp. NBC_00568]|uniref:hypothetical protein n=1 Tax=Streptomyces sp. NBC_00568 TaxID=2975779 RepID=UPI002252F701|nr:hypothetical protein [Streptomyces sp. NBC_00568]MCX4993399.1 hypothetical protein [Streptomyces sp. NBC_00568]
MPARPGFIQPDKDATEAAMDRALDALAAVFEAIGPGERTLEIAILRTDGMPLHQAVKFSPTADVKLSGILGADDFYTLAVFLVFALEGSTVTGATLIATTAAKPHPRACGWTVRAGWLHPMSTTDVEVALIPCPGVTAEDRDIYTAPALPEPTADDEGTDRA